MYVCVYISVYSLCAYFCEYHAVHSMYLSLPVPPPPYWLCCPYMDPFIRELEGGGGGFGCSKPYLETSEGFEGTPIGSDEERGAMRRWVLCQIEGGRCFLQCIC